MIGTTPARHILSFIRRYLLDEFIDVAAFQAVSAWQDSVGIKLTVNIDFDDKITPTAIIDKLSMGVCSVFIRNNKISIEQRKSYAGIRGIFIPDEIILNYEKIYKEKNNTIYSYAVIQYSGGIERQYLGASNINANYNAASAYVQDNTATWEANALYDKFLYLTSGTTGFDDKIVRIIGNTNNKIFFDSIQNDWNTNIVCNYAILENNNCYSANYSTGNYVLTSGADAIATTILLTQIAEKLIIEMNIIDENNILQCGDYITVNNPDEGLSYQIFRIEELRRSNEDPIIWIKAIDEILYPYINNEITQLNPPVLSGTRFPTTAALSWTTVNNVFIYKLCYGTRPDTLTNIIYTTSNSRTIENLISNITYYVQVSALNYEMIESEKSNLLELTRLDFISSYIDGSSGYEIEPYDVWGKLEDYYFAIAYKEINFADIRFLNKTDLAILDASQISSNGEVAQLVPSGQNKNLSILGYVDGAGVTDNNSVSSVVATVGGLKYIKVPNSFGKYVRIDDVSIVPSGSIFAGSNDWFLQRSSGEYYNYWSIYNFMGDISNANYREWFKVWKIDKTIGCFESNIHGVAIAGRITNNLFTVLSRAKFSTWIINQWTGYYIYFPTLNRDKKWYKISGNNTNELVIDISLTETDGASIVIDRYVINDCDSIGFDGIFLDDIWTELYDLINNTTIDMDGDLNSTSTWVGTNYLTDNSKTWDMLNGSIITNLHKWVGYYVEINGDGNFWQIIHNDNTHLNFAGPSGYNQAGLSYRIISPLEYRTGHKYSYHMGQFLGGDGGTWGGIISYIENVVTRKLGNSATVAKGNIILNTYPNDWSAYQIYVNAITQGTSQHFVMDEAIQSSWNNSVVSSNKNFRVLDWRRALDRHNQLKIRNSAATKYVRVASLGYPYCQKSLQWHLGAGLLLSKYLASKIEDIVAGGDPNLKEFYYDLMQAQNIDQVDGRFQTIGMPVSEYVSDIDDKYAICYREFSGGWLFYNPANKLQTMAFSFLESVVCLHTGQVHSGSSRVFLLPRSINIYYKVNSVAADAASFLAGAELFNYVNCNAGWITLTSAGASKVGNNSIWIKYGTGHSAHKNIIDNNNYSVPSGSADLLVHGGNALYPVISGTNAETENIIGANYNWVSLSDETILSIVKIVDTTSVPNVTLIAGIDYKIDIGQGYLGGAGKWHSRIFFIKDFSTKNCTVYYYKQGLALDGSPDKNYTVPELGIIYRKNNLELWTGGINYSDCVSTGTQLIEGSDFYFSPEPIRWTWQYRRLLSKKETNPIKNNSTITIIPKDLKNALHQTNKQAYQWGNIDTNNLILIDTARGTDHTVHGGRAYYATKTVVKPKILIYGFANTPRNELNFSITLPPIDRGGINPFRYENKIKMKEGFLYDEVIITGMYDGVLNVGGSSAGAYGSIQGWMDDKGFTSEIDALFYLTNGATTPLVIIINDNFLEGMVASPSGVGQYGSWLDWIDFQFIYHANNDQIMIIDRRAGLSAFMWHHGDATIIKNSLYKKNGYSLANIFGVNYYSGFQYSELSNTDAEIYIADSENSENFVKFTDDLSVDLRIFDNSLIGITDHYITKPEANGAYASSDLWISENNPVYNQFEQGGTFLNYIPRSAYVRENKILKSKLFTKTIDPSDVNLTGNKYIQNDLANICLRKEPCITYYDYANFTFAKYSSEQHTLKDVSGHTGEALNTSDDTDQINGNLGYCVVFMRYSFSGHGKIDPTNWIGKYIHFPELDWNGTDYIIDPDEPYWTGYTGHYLSNLFEYDSSNPSCYKLFGALLGNRTFAAEVDGSYINLYPKDYAFTALEDGDPFVEHYGYSLTTASFSELAYADGVYPPDYLNRKPMLNWGYVGKFDAYNDDFAGYYNLSERGYTVNQNKRGPIPCEFKRPLFRMTVNGFTRVGTSNEVSISVPYGGIDQLAAISSRISHAKMSCAIFNVRNASTLEAKDNYTIWNAPIGRVGRSFFVIESERLANQTDLQNTGFVGTCWIWYSEHLDNTYYKGRDMSYANIPIDTALGGMYSLAGIYSRITPIGRYEAASEKYSVSSAGDSTIAGLWPYEVFFNKKQKEFAFDYNTGLLTGLAYYRNGENNPPNIFWLGISEDDTHRVIDNLMGTKIIFTGVQQTGDLYVYYNTITEMLNVYEEDLNNDIPWIWENTYKMEDFINNVEVNYFILDFSLLDGEDVLK